MLGAMLDVATLKLFWNVNVSTEIKFLISWTSFWKKIVNTVTLVGVTKQRTFILSKDHQLLELIFGQQFVKD
jgi:hypothetical protein